VNNRKDILVLVACTMAAIAGPPAGACSVPVFRYALEEWPPDPYLAVVFHRGPLGDKDQAVIEGLKRAADDPNVGANIEVQTVDLAKEVPAECRKLHEKCSPKTLPWVAVVNPMRFKGAARPLEELVAWSGPLDKAEVALLLDSPCRKELARRLLKGDSVVWLLLESGSKEKDDAAARTLSAELAQLQKTLAGSLSDPDQPAAEGMEDVDVSPGVPLKVGFSVLRISRGEAAERGFVTVLLGLMSGSKYEGPVAMPVFGRGRALTVLAGQDINSENIGDVIGFLTGDCSCQIKGLNPGIDLLMAAGWDAALSGHLMGDNPSPELTSVMPGATVIPATRPTSHPMDILDNNPPQSGGKFMFNIIWVLSSVFIVVVIVSVVMMRRNGSRR